MSIHVYVQKSLVNSALRLFFFLLSHIIKSLGFISAFLLFRRCWINWTKRWRATALDTRANTVTGRGVILVFQWPLWFRMPPSSEKMRRHFPGLIGVGAGVQGVQYSSAFTPRHCAGVFADGVACELFIPGLSEVIYFIQEAFPISYFIFLCDWIYGSPFWRFSFVVYGLFVFPSQNTYQWNSGFPDIIQGAPNIFRSSPNIVEIIEQSLRTKSSSPSFCFYYQNNIWLKYQTKYWKLLSSYSSSAADWLFVET